MARAIDILEPDQLTWALGEERLKVLLPLATAERTTFAEMDAAARQLGITRAYCYRLLGRCRVNPTVTAVLPRVRGRAQGAQMLPPEIEALIETAIDDVYLKRGSPTIAALMREIGRRCFENNLTPPSRKAVTARIRHRDQRTVLRRRRGGAFARTKLGRVVGHLSVDEPLGLVQIDHTLADVMVVSEVDRCPLSRPWLTLAIDVATRMVAGFYLSLEPPSALSVALVITNAVWPKEEYLQSRGVDISWPIAGLPARLHLDNAKEFRSRALARGAAQYGIELHYRPPATPHWGGHIERLIGTTMGALRVLPGATGSSVGDRPKHPEAAAMMTLDELEVWLIHQIAGIYHNTCHCSLGRAPITAWNGTVAKLAASHRLPTDRDSFFRDFLPFRLRTVQRQGISLFGITYSDGILSTLLAKPRQKFMVRYDPRDMSRVYLRDPDGVYWPIPYSDRRLPPVTLGEIRAASRRVRAAGERYVTQRQLFASLAQQRAVVEEARAKTRVARRELERSHRALRGAAKAARSGARSEPVPSAETEAEPIRPFEVEEWS